MKSFFQEHAGIIIILFLFFLLGLLRLNDLSLYTDSTRYLLWGNSLAHAKGFVDDSQPEPEYYIVNAPFYSVILAPVLLAFPLSLVMAKIWTLLIGVLALYLFFTWMQNYVSRWAALAAASFLAFNPLSVVLSTEVLSETAFLVMLFTTFLLVDRMEKQTPERWSFGLLVFLISTITLVREIGVATVAATIVFFSIRKQWRTVFFTGGGAALVFGLWTYRNLGIVGVPESSQSPNLVYIFQHFVTAPETSAFHEMAQRVLINLKSHGMGLSGMLFYRWPMNLIVQPSSMFLSTAAVMNVIQYGVFLIVFPGMLFGILQDFRNSRTALFRLLFLGIYLCIILAYPVQDVRFLFPLVPVALFYLAISAVKLKNTLPFKNQQRTFVFGAFFLFAVLPNLICLNEVIKTNRHYENDPVNFSSSYLKPGSRSSYFSTPWSAMGKSMTREIPAGAIIASPDKEIVPFAPNQKFLEVNRAVPLPMFETLLRDNAAEYLFAPTVFDTIVEYQVMINESNRFWFEPVMHMNRLNIFRIHSKLEHPHISQPIQEFRDSASNIVLLQAGRRALHEARYIDAQKYFSRLQAHFPGHSDIVYQLLLVHTFTLNEAAALKDIQQLYLSPTAASYIAPAQIHLHAMNTLLRMRSVEDPVYQAEQLFSTGRLYWNLGYPLQAYRLLQESVKLDPEFFVGLLWAWHFGIQVGDTLASDGYLSRLKAIDHENPIVLAYQKISLLQDSLRKTNIPRRQSSLHISLASEYDSIDLPTEALDETERALGCDPQNKEAWKYLGYLFTKKKCPIAAERAKRNAIALDTAPTPK